MDELEGFFGIEICACYVRHFSMSVLLRTQLWSEGVHIPSGPEDVEYDPGQGRNVSLSVQFGQYAKAVDGHGIFLRGIPH